MSVAEHSICRGNNCDQVPSMKRPKDMIRLALLIFFAIGFSHGVAANTLATEPLIVFLVRHAERLDASPDAELSLSGKERAKRLASVLKDAEIQRIHSTDFIRTRDTAAPIAAELRKKVELYEHRGLQTLIQKLRKAGGRHLVVGHSNTTPAVVKLLDGNPGSPINEAHEYDRLYIVEIGAEGKATTVLVRYGNSVDANATRTKPTSGR